MNFEESVFIKSPIKLVFKFLSNFRSHKQFHNLYKDTKQVSDGKMRVGTKVFSKIFFLGRKIETDSEITEFVPEQVIRIKSLSGPVPSDIVYKLEPKENGTEVTMQYQVDPGSFFRMGETFLRPRLGEEMTNSMQNLKKIIEAKAASKAS